jgi:DNA polymerase IV
MVIGGNMGQRLTPWFALIDMNSYFAMLEQQANPYLRNKPVVVVKEAGRSCVIAASKEAKKLGVKTGESIKDARQKAPNLISIPGDFDKYFHNTKNLRNIFLNLSPDVDLFSLDEAFIDLTGCRRLYPDARTFFELCRQKVAHDLGGWVTFSLGFGENRIQAKLASDFAGPDNYFEITPENLDSVFSQAKVEDICGIGFRLTTRLHRLNIHHPYQLNFCDDEFLLEHFGKFWGPELRKIGQGKESHMLNLRQRELPHMKSVSRSKTLFVANADQRYIEQMIYNLAEDMCFKARRMKLAGRHVYLSIFDTDHRYWGRVLRLKGRHVSYTDDVFSLLLSNFHNITLSWRLQNLTPKIIKIGVGLSDLHPLAELPQSWLPETEKRQKIYSAIDEINEKHGLFTIKPAKLVDFKIIRPEVTGFLGDRQYQLQFST